MIQSHPVGGLNDALVPLEWTGRKSHCAERGLSTLIEKHFMKTAYVVIIAGACAQFIVSASEPKPGEAPPPLGLESILQAPSDAQASWGALKGKVVSANRATK